MIPLIIVVGLGILVGCIIGCFFGAAWIALGFALVLVGIFCEV